MKLMWRMTWLGALWATGVVGAETFYLELQPSGRKLGPFEYREDAEVRLGKALFKVKPIVKEPTTPSGSQDVTPSYDGIQLGDHYDDVLRKLIWVPGIHKNERGVPFFQKSNNEPFHVYQVFRSPDQTKSISHVFVLFEDDRVDMIQDTFHGDWIWKLEDAQREYQRIKQQLMATWGPPTNEDDGFTEWLRPDAVAVLRLDEPNDTYGAPELKFGVRKTL